MKQTDNRFWTAWVILFLLAVGSLLAVGWSEDTALLGVAYGLSLLSIGLCCPIKRRTAWGHLIVTIAYNAIFSYNLVFNSRYGTGLTWWFYALMLNTLQSLSLLVYMLIINLKTPKRQ